MFWINAESKATLESEFQDIAEELGILGIKTSDGKFIETKKLVKSVYRHLTVKIKESAKMVLMVLMEVMTRTQFWNIYRSLLTIRLVYW